MRKKFKRILAVSLAMSMMPCAVPAMADPVTDVPQDANVQEIPKGTLVLNGLFDVKSLEAGASKYLYINTYPEKGTAIVEVDSSDLDVVQASFGNNSAGMTVDDMSENQSNYNYVKLDAVSAGEATVTVTVEDMGGNLGTVTESFEVQVIEPEYAGTQRIVTDISEDWSFKLERDMEKKPAKDTVPAVDGTWDSVTIPHCWNIDDGANGGDDYHKGTGWYVREFPAEELSAETYGGKQLYLEMGAACKISEIYVNGAWVDRHEGGYSRIRVDLTDYLKLGEDNTVAVSVNNEINDRTPISGDFTVFGGLYRDISLIAAGDIHMDLDQETSFGGRSLYVSQQGMQGVSKETTVADVFGEGGKLNVVGEVKNSGKEAKTVSASAKVYDENWQLAASHDFDPIEVEAGKVHQFTSDMVVANPILWNGLENPYQYNVVFEVKDESGTVVDRERDRIGFRFYCADPKEGFFLNGKSYPLRGVNSHQDRYNRGYAATYQDREQDMAMMEEIGVNAIRFAHYQHDPYVYELAAERGITVWAEIPMVTYMKNTWGFYDSTINNMKELIHQAYNCPSVLMWGIQNEQEQSNSGVTVLLDKLYKTCKEEDPTRMVTVATSQNSLDDVNESTWDKLPVSWQSDVSGWNKYFGIYQRKDVRYFGNWINQVHNYGAKHKTIYGSGSSIKDPDGKSYTIPVTVHGNVAMSEYGADGSPFIHEEKPGYSAGSQSEEFVSQWHEVYYKVIDESEWMWGSYIWNMFEFGSDGRATTPDRYGTNTKGIVTYDRTIKKDPFYFYKANWSDTPTLQITSERFKDRYQDDTSAKVYSNMESVELFVNGVSQGTLIANSNTEPALNNDGDPDKTLIPNTQMGKFVWDIKLQQGDNTVVAVGRDSKGRVFTNTVTWTRKLYGTAEIVSTRYNVNSASHTISGITGGTTVRDMLANIEAVQNAAFAPYTADDVLIEDLEMVVQLGMKVKVTSEDGANKVDYVVVSAPISQGKKATAIADERGKYPAKNAVDGDTTTRWGSGGSYPGWIQIDLGQVYTVTKLDTLWLASASRKYSFDVAVSTNGRDYVTVLQKGDSEQGQTEPTWTGRQLPDDTIARYIKLNVYGYTGSPSIFEIQAIGFGLNSKTLSVDNAARTIAGVDPEMTTQELLDDLSVEGDYNTLTAEQNGKTVIDAAITLDTTVVVGYGEGKKAVYKLLIDGPDLLPISQGKTATAQDINVGDKTFPNEDSGDGCFDNSDSDVAANINDGDLTTRWTGAMTGDGHTIPINAYPADVLIDLEEEYVLNKLFMSNFDPAARKYEFVVYAGNDPENLKKDENIILDMRNNTEFSQGTKDVSGTGRYILLSVTGNTAPSEDCAASVYEMSVYGYRFAGSEYKADPENKMISDVPAQTTVSAFLKTLDIEGNYVAKIVLGNKVLDRNSVVTEGTELRITDKDGGNPVTYGIAFAPEMSDIPVSQGMAVHAHDVTTNYGKVPNEDKVKGDYAHRISDGDDSTRWTGAFNADYTACYYPAAVTVDMTNPLSTEDYYYLTGVKIHFYEGGGDRYYGYNMYANNIVGIPVGFVVDAANNTTTGWVEHWTENGTNEIKDLTLNVQKCSDKSSYAAPSVYELQVFAWRLKGNEFTINESNKTIDIGTESITVAELRNDLRILGNCTVKFVSAEGSELGWNDIFTRECKLVVTDVKDHVFEYKAAPVEEKYYTTSIKVEEQPGKLEYAVGEKFDPEGMKVTAQQKASPSNAARTVEIDLDELKYDYDFSEAGEQIVTVTYTGLNEDLEEDKFTAEVKVTVKEETPGEDKFYYTTSIKVTAQPDKREYAVDDEFDPEGMEVTAYQKASPSEAARTITVDLDELEYDYDFSEAGKQTVTVTYMGLDKEMGEKEFTAEVKVTVKDETPDEDEFYYTTSIKVNTPPDKLKYGVGETFDPEGMEVTAYQKASPSEAARTVKVDEDELEYDYDFSEAGTKTVKVTYTGLNSKQEEKRFTAEVKVTVTEKTPEVEEYFYTTSIKVDKKPTKLTYRTGDEFDPKGMKVSAKMKSYPDNRTKTVALNLDDLEFEYDFSTAGEKNVRVIYYGMGKNQEEKRFLTNVPVTVKKSSSDSGSSSDSSSSTVAGMTSTPGTWKQEAAGWRYAYQNGGYAQNKWEMVNGSWYFFNQEGYMAIDWQYINNNWYYLNPLSGAMTTGWHSDPQDGHWYYLSPASGAVKTGWQQVGNKWYYLNPTASEPSWKFDEESGKWVYEKKNALPFGAMYKDTVTPDGYKVDSDGAWIQ